MHDENIDWGEFVIGLVTFMFNVFIWWPIKITLSILLVFVGFFSFTGS